MRMEDKRIIKKILISFLAVLISMILWTVCNEKTFAAKFPGSKGNEQGNMKKEIRTGDTYIFDTQVLWKNPYIFCVQPDVLLKDNSTGQIKKEHYINTKKGEKINIYSKDDMATATIYAFLTENKEDIPASTYDEYLQNSAYQHLIWMQKNGKRISEGIWIPKNYNAKKGTYYQTNTVSARLPWCNIYYKGSYREAWTSYDSEGNKLKECYELSWVPAMYEIIESLGWFNLDINSFNLDIGINDKDAKVNYDANETELNSYNNSIIIGPFQIKNTRDNDEIKTITATYKKNGNQKKSILSKGGDIKFIFEYYTYSYDMNSGSTTISKTWSEDYNPQMGGITGKFYIVIDKNSGITSIDDINIRFERQHLEARWWDIELSASQNLEYGWGNFDTEDINVKIDVPTLIPPVQVELDKVDTAGDAVEGAKFSIEYSNGLKGETKTVGKDGKIVFSQVQPTSPDEFTATITETFTPAGYKKLEKPIVLKFTYDQNKAVWKVEKISGPDEKITIGTVTKDSKSGINKIPVIVENKSIIEKLTLSKTSSVGGGKVEGAKFKLTLTNVASIKNHQIPEAGKVTIIETTNSDGNLVLEDIEIKNLNEPVVITIEEIEAPVGYKKIEGTITVTLKRKGNTYTIHKAEKKDTVTDDEFKAGEVTLKNHELELDIQDIPVMNLGGIVWYEGEIIDKDPTHAEAERKPLETVKVSLYKGNNKNAVADTTSSDGTGTATYTNNKGEKITENLAKGEYMFTDIPAGDDYYVVFEYDGIEYQAITNSKEQAYMSTTKKDSKIEKEPNRDEFNTATTTISGSGKEGESITNAGWIIKYDLDNNSTPNKAIYKATYKNEEDMKNNIQQYVKGQTYTYLKNTADWMGTWNTDGTINKSHYAFDINCGLNKKFFDLSLGTDVKEATVKINGNQTTYTYDQILDGKLDEKLNKSSNSPIEYNLYLAHSDYNYRITDYKVPGDTNGEPIENKYDETTKENFGKIKDNKNNTELEVYVTYKLALKNQSTQYDAKVNLVEYHFDDKYAFLQEKNKNIKLTEGTNLENRVLMIDTSDLQINGGETKPLYLTFKVLPDKNGNKCVLGEDYLNQAEIVSYTTGGGLVDEDSAPGNAFLDQNNVRYEDDTDEANGIKIKLKDNAERSISGKVFDASNNNGVSDVIVQLIELVEINNQQYEYIWQETVAAPKDKEGKPTVTTTVKTTATSGGRGETYTVENVGQGEYKFTERIIPGNYIVRFIYGDGSTYDITDNTLKYNGEDYKSTYVDYNYNAKWYNDTKIGEKYLYDEKNDEKNNDISKAVDNEARRLKVMSYAVDVDGKKGAELAKLDGDTNTEGLKDVLANTWMCAETLKIKMPVDADTQANTSDNTTVANGSNPNIGNTQFANVNFGLMERPKTKLVLEKHITGLTIKPVASGVNLIANATADINDILKATQGSEIELEGQKDGLFATKSGRTNRGLWYLQTDTTEIAQGADAYITYTYVIKNEGDEDYLNEDLIALYENDINGYVNKLSNLETEVKNAKKSITGTPYKNGTYILDFYYTGTKGKDNEKVLASVEQIQEALNPKVKFVNSTTDFTKADRNVGNKYPYYNRDGELQENNNNIKEIITSKEETSKKLLQTGKTLKEINDKNEKKDFINNTMDTSKKLVVSVGLSASEIENDGVYDSYIAQVTHYTNAAGRRDQSTPANLSYVHSEDTGITLDKYNEEDEFWAETFRITKPTGEDKITPVQIAIITISAVAVLGVGIILIKKFVLKK